jgi:hypothetical protein
MDAEFDRLDAETSEFMRPTMQWDQVVQAEHVETTEWSEGD